jgi:hypothetical protein
MKKRSLIQLLALILLTDTGCDMTCKVTPTMQQNHQPTPNREDEDKRMTQANDAAVEARRSAG